MNSGAGGFSDLTFHADGTVYGVNLSGELFEIDTITGQIVIVHEFGSRVQALTSSLDGLLYISDDDGNLWTYQKDTDHAEHLGIIPHGFGGDLAFYNGELYMSSTMEDLIIKVNIAHPELSEVVLEDAGGFGGAMYGIVTYAEDCNDVRFYGIMAGNKIIYKIDLESGALDTTCILDDRFYGGATSHEFLASAPIKLVEATIIKPECGKHNGSIGLNMTGGTAPLTYYLNGVSYGSQNTFSGLMQGYYLIDIIDIRGCSPYYETTLDIQQIQLIDTFTTMNTTCGFPNGEIEVFTHGNNPVMFSLDGIQLQQDHIFDSLLAGTYNIHVIDPMGCIDSTQVVLSSLPWTMIETVQVLPTTCGLPNGSASVLLNSELNSTFSLNNNEFQTSPIFLQLSGGDYWIIVKDENGCLDEFMFSIDSSTQLIINSVIVHLPSCSLENGSVELKTLNATGQSYFELNGTHQLNPVFEELTSGMYKWMVSDDAGCTVTGEIELAQSLDGCGIFIPSVFSPNGDGINDVFFIHTKEPVFVSKLLIFDRWGNQAFKAENFYTTESIQGWDGNTKTSKAHTGVYVYVVEIVHPDGSTAYFKGDLTLIR